MKRLAWISNKFSWKDKLLVLYITIVAIMIVVNIIAVSFCVRMYFSNQTSDLANQNIAQTQIILDRVVSDNKKAFDEVTRDDRIISLIQAREDFIGGDDRELLRGYTEYKYMSGRLNEIQEAYNIENIKIYMRSGYVYDVESRSSYPWEQVLSSKWMKKLSDEGMSSVFLDNSYFGDEMTKDKSFHHIQVIRSTKDYQEIIGVMHISISEEFIHDLLQNSKLSENSILYLENSQGEVVTQLDERISSNNYKTFRVNVSHSDLSLVSQVSIDDMMRPYYTILWITLGISLILLVSGIFASRAITNSITKKLVSLIGHMAKIKDRNFEPIPIDGVYDDVDRSIEGYNNLLHEFEEILEEQKRNADRTKRLELKILREQINPHFLYNTLEIVNSLAIINNQPEISDVARWMSEYYKLSLNHGKDLMTVQEELRHVELYIHLQNLRFDKDIDFMWDIPEDILDCNILKMLMQPIVENSVKHGFKDKTSEHNNVISIVGYNEGDYIVFVINDNGGGIAREKIETLLLQSSAGFGLKNVNDRIRMFYGEDCGITIESEHGVDTSVTVRIKKISS